MMTFRSGLTGCRFSSPQRHHWGGSARFGSDEPLTQTQDPREPSQELELTRRDERLVRSLRTGRGVRRRRSEKEKQARADIKGIDWIIHWLDRYCNSRLSVSTRQRGPGAGSACCALCLFYPFVLTANKRRGWYEWETCGYWHLDTSID